MSAAGWDEEALSKQALEQIRSRLICVRTEFSKGSVQVDSFVTDLRKRGVNVSAIPGTRGPTEWVQTLWDQMTTHPWWVSSSGGQRSAVICSSSAERAGMASSLFIHDIWSSLGEEPDKRMPSFRRVNLISLMSPDAMNAFLGSGETTDLLICHGGFLDEDSMYQNFAHLSAIKSMFKGFLLYEAVVPRGDSPAIVANVARRSGFPIVLGTN